MSEIDYSKRPTAAEILSIVCGLSLIVNSLIFVNLTKKINQIDEDWQMYLECNDLPAKIHHQNMLLKSCVPVSNSLIQNTDKTSYFLHS